MMIGSRAVAAGTHGQHPSLVAMTGGYLVAWQACHKRGAQLSIPSRHGSACDLLIRFTPCGSAYIAALTKMCKKAAQDWGQKTENPH
jgi:hypothetical protein